MANSHHQHHNKKKQHQKLQITTKTASHPQTINSSHLDKDQKNSTGTPQLRWWILSTKTNFWSAYISYYAAKKSRNSMLHQEVSGQSLYGVVQEWWAHSLCHVDEAENSWYSENTWEGTPIISSENFLLFSTMPPNRFFVRNFEGSNNQCFECGLGSMLGGYQLVPQKI